MAFDVPLHNQPILTAESPTSYTSMRKVLASLKWLLYIYVCNGKLLYNCENEGRLFSFMYMI